MLYRRRSDRNSLPIGRSAVLLSSGLSVALVGRRSGWECRAAGGSAGALRVLRRCVPVPAGGVRALGRAVGRRSRTVVLRSPVLWLESPPAGAARVSSRRAMLERGRLRSCSSARRGLLPARAAVGKPACPARGG